jgi:hypothetical protein
MKSGKKESVDYILLNLLPHLTSTPCFEKAQLHREQYSAGGGPKGDRDLNSAMFFKTQAFKKYGSGVYLFFSLIRMLLLTFLVMSFAALPALLSDLKGDGLRVYASNSVAKSLMQASLGNQRQVEYERLLRDGH